MRPALPQGLEARLAELFPGAAVVEVEAVGADGSPDETSKAFGYGRPLRLSLRRGTGEKLELVFHLAEANGYGHERRSDRAAEQLQAWDSFGTLPRHARAVDVGALTADGTLLPLDRVGELYLLTEWAEGTLYAEDLRRIAATGEYSVLDVARLDALLDWMVEVHRLRGSGPAAYVRAWRDLVGSGEGIAGIVDGYGTGAPGAPRARLDAIEASCLAWRQRHKLDVGRLRRTHGDLHPFNIVFAPGAVAPTLLDTSRGSEGDPADDVSCLALNLLFFGLEHRERWARGLGTLWRRLWARVLAESPGGLLEVVAPFFAWRGLVVCNPAWYPHLREEDRDRMLRFVERALAAPRFDPAFGEEALR